MSDETKPTIAALPGGPLLVKDLPTLVTIDGQETSPDPVFALCRCGGSKNKPFCDGTHKTNGFSDVRETDKPLDKERVHEGDDIGIRDNRTICCHNGTCTETLPAVFEVSRSPWIDAKAATKEDVVALVRKCPSGALSYELDGKTVRDFNERAPKVLIERDGPIRIEGSVRLDVDENLQPPSKEHFTLCRCGASKNKPYCDGSHYYAKFSDDA